MKNAFLIIMIIRLFPCYGGVEIYPLKNQIDDKFEMFSPNKQEMNLFNQMRPDNALVDTNVVPMDTSEDLYDDPFGGYSDDLVTDALNVDPISSDYYDTHAVKNRISNQNQLSPQQKQYIAMQQQNSIPAAGQKRPSTAMPTNSKNKKTSSEMVPTAQQLYNDLIVNNAREAFQYERPDNDTLAGILNPYVDVTHDILNEAFVDAVQPVLTGAQSTLDNLESYRDAQKEQLKANMKNLFEPKKK